MSFLDLTDMNWLKTDMNWLNSASAAGLGVMGGTYDVYHNSVGFAQVLVNHDVMVL